jgi:hypothetical protein
MLALAHGFGGDPVDVDLVTSWLDIVHATAAGPNPSSVQWTWCASEGELCD